MVHKFVRIAGAGFLALFAVGGPALAIDSVMDGAYTEAQAERGLPLYLEHCAVCHGPSMLGILPFVPALDGINFPANWRDQPLGDLLAFVIDSMPYDFPGTLDAQVYADALAWVLRHNGYPAGEVELPPDRELLKLVRFVSLP